MKNNNKKYRLHMGAMIVSIGAITSVLLMHSVSSAQVQTNSTNLLGQTNWTPISQWSAVDSGTAVDSQTTNFAPDVTKANQVFSDYTFTMDNAIRRAVPGHTWQPITPATSAAKSELSGTGAYVPFIDGGQLYWSTTQGYMDAIKQNKFVHIGFLSAPNHGFISDSSERAHQNMFNIERELNLNVNTTGPVNSAKTFDIPVTFGGGLMFDYLTTTENKDAVGQVTNVLDEVRRAGGDYIFSFGGWRHNTPAIAVMQASKINPTKFDEYYLAAMYAYVIDKLDLNFIDFDIEGSDSPGGNVSTGDILGNDPIRPAMPSDVEAAESRAMRLRALKVLRAVPKYRNKININFTLPCHPTGLTPYNIDELVAALNMGVVDKVDLMTMDYNSETHATVPGEMALSAISAANSLIAQLKGRDDLIIPKDRSLYNLIGITPMYGKNDTKYETFFITDAKILANWAINHNIGYIGGWVLQRDFENYIRPGGPLAAISANHNIERREFNDMKGTLLGVDGMTGLTTGLHLKENAFANVFKRVITKDYFKPEEIEVSSFFLDQIKHALQIDDLNELYNYDEGRNIPAGAAHDNRYPNIDALCEDAYNLEFASLTNSSYYVSYPPVTYTTTEYHEPLSAKDFPAGSIVTYNGTPYALAKKYKAAKYPTILPSDQKWSYPSNSDGYFEALPYSTSQVASSNIKNISTTDFVIKPEKLNSLPSSSTVVDASWFSTHPTINYDSNQSNAKWNNITYTLLPPTSKESRNTNIHITIKSFGYTKHILLPVTFNVSSVDAQTQFETTYAPFTSDQFVLKTTSVTTDTLKSLSASDFSSMPTIDTNFVEYQYGFEKRNATEYYATVSIVSKENYKLFKKFSLIVNIIDNQFTLVDSSVLQAQNPVLALPEFRYTGSPTALTLVGQMYTPPVIGGKQGKVEIIVDIQGERTFIVKLLNFANTSTVKTIAPTIFIKNGQKYTNGDVAFGTNQGADNLSTTLASLPGVLPMTVEVYQDLTGQEPPLLQPGVDNQNDVDIVANQLSQLINSTISETQLRAVTLNASSTNFFTSLGLSPISTRGVTISPSKAANSLSVTYNLSKGSVTKSVSVTLSPMVDPNIGDVQAVKTLLQARTRSTKASNIFLPLAYNNVAFTSWVADALGIAQLSTSEARGTTIYVTKVANSDQLSYRITKGTVNETVNVTVTPGAAENTPGELPTNTETPVAKEKANVGLIIGIIAGVLAGIGVIGLGVWGFIKYKSMNEELKALKAKRKSEKKQKAPKEKKAKTPKVKKAKEPKVAKTKKGKTPKQPKVTKPKKAKVEKVKKTKGKKK